MLTKMRLQGFRRAEAPAIEAPFRDLYTRVLINAGVDKRVVIGVSSSIDGEGKTTVAARFATVLAEDSVLIAPSGRPGNILIVECNQGAGGLSEAFDLAETPGLIQYLQRECTLEEAIKRTSSPRLSILPVGGTARNFSMVIRTGAMAQLLLHLRERFELILLDLPSVLTTTDTQVLGELTDQLLLVVRCRVTPWKVVRQALEEVEPERLAGIVLNDSKPDLPHWLDSRL